MDRVVLGRRVAQARQERGLTQHQLGEPLGLDHSAVSRLERGERKLSVPELVVIAETLQYPLSLLVGDVPPAVVSRRANPSASHASTSRLDRELELLEADVRYLHELNQLPRTERGAGARTPRNHGAAERMASGIRERLALGVGPIDDLGGVAAALGLHTYVCALGVDNPDGGCLAVEVGESTAAGVAVVNGDMPSGRRRMTLAHELGHWLSGDAYDSAAAQAEQMVNSFAIHFLMPRSGVQSRWDTAVPLRERCLRLAADFQVSWSAALGQLSNLQLVDRVEFDRLTRDEPRRGEYLTLGLSWAEDLRAPYLSPDLARAAINSYVSGVVREDRALEILRGTLDRHDLPPIAPVDIDDLRSAFTGHGA